ncbi:PQQ-dependent sugar dehydrogenase [Natronorubrum halophilum]|uniref:PQQ-dependent sugar dehydrogenase n=1 Tax=Natronorubrum halophilum TaxID=1702106 RepID=UPI001EE78666|nr:PQQ-dependent sugar dehydrogenase [Natronorubrum halophilum]
MREQPDERSVSAPESDDDHPTISRRRVMQATAAAGGVVALSDLGIAQEAETIELGGETSGWVGVAPDDIADEENPTLELEEGTAYELTWENLDGQAHNFVIEGSDGEELERTELMTEQGETQTLEFEATSEMAEYYCEPHAGTMRGEISVGGGQEAPADDESDAESENFFEPGAEIGLRTVAEGMTAPTDFAADPDGERYFVADQIGELWVVTDDGLQSEPFLDVSDRLVELGTFEGDYADPEQDYDERGLLGVELHPEFSENGRFFLHYSAPPNDETPEGWSHVEVVSEFRADEELTQGDPDSERVLMEFQKPQYNHDAGPMAFGPDGYLYVPMGDGGGANDDMEGHVEDWYDDNAGGNGQDVSENLLGGIHRIDVDQEGTDQPYAIPDDNPLVDEEDALPEYYAWGMRNPFGISFDSEGRLFASDAGQDLFEEANIVEAGGNYGWNVKEGTHCFSTESPSDPPTECPDSTPDEPPYNGQELQDPIVEYPHVYGEEMVGITIIGGHVYEAGQIPDLEGKYVFGDWTADPSREEPAGRLLAASEPDEGVDTGADDGNESISNESIDNESISNESVDNESISNESVDNESISNESTGNESTGNETDSGDETEIVPRDELWTMEELQVSGSEDGSFPYFVRQFGQDLEGNVYVLANRMGIPEGDTGVVMEIVPPDEGEDIEPPEEQATEDTEEEPTDDENATDNDTETDGMADDENVTADENVTGENATAGGNATVDDA